MYSASELLILMILNFYPSIVWSYVHVPAIRSTCCTQSVHTALALHSAYSYILRGLLHLETFFVLIIRVCLNLISTKSSPASRANSTYLFLCPTIIEGISVGKLYQIF